MNVNDILLHIIKCPVCGDNDFEIFDLPDKGSFRLSGAVICNHCGKLYVCQDNILSLLKPEYADVERERAFISNYLSDLPGPAAADRFEALSQAGIDGDDQWVLSEKDYWDLKKYSGYAALSRYSWNRYEVRERHIINYIKNEARGKLLLDVGGGNSGTLYHTMNPEEFGYTLVCAEISFKALLNAGLHHPSAILVQCDAISLPFRVASFDMVMEFGVLHHLPDNTEVLRKHLTLLKDGGYLGMHEPTDRRKAFLSSIPWIARLKKEESEHNDFIREAEAIAVLGQDGEIIHSHIEYSPLRNWLVTLFVDILKIESKYLHYAICFIDNLAINTAGRIWNKMDGNSLLLVFRKSYHE